MAFHLPLFTNFASRGFSEIRYRRCISAGAASLPVWPTQAPGKEPEARRRTDRV